VASISLARYDRAGFGARLVRRAGHHDAAPQAEAPRTRSRRPQCRGCDECAYAVAFDESLLKISREVWVNFCSTDAQAGGP